MPTNQNSNVSQRADSLTARLASLRKDFVEMRGNGGPSSPWTQRIQFLSDISAQVAWLETQRQQLADAVQASETNGELGDAVRGRLFRILEQAIPALAPLRSEVDFFRLKSDNTIIVSLSTKKFFIENSRLVEYVLPAVNGADWTVGRSWGLNEIADWE